MFKNFLLIASRNVARHKVFTFIKYFYGFRMNSALKNLTRTQKSIAVGAILIALLTVSFQAYKVTEINPAKALKVE